MSSIVWPYDPNPATTCNEAPLYDDVIATGLQTVVMFGSYFCTDFAIAQKLVWTGDATTIHGIKSSAWLGYYTWTPGKCAWTARKGTLERMGALIANVIGKTKKAAHKGERIRKKELLKQKKDEL